MAPDVINYIRFMKVFYPDALLVLIKSMYSYMGNPPLKDCNEK